MQVATVVLGCFLFGQVPATGPSPAAVEPQTAPEAQAVEEPRRNRLTPPEMVAEALVLPPSSKLTGQPLTLLAALCSVADRRQQLEVIHTYWRLVEAVAVYHFCLDYDNRLLGFEARTDEAALLRMSRASSAASVLEAEVAAVAAQHELTAQVLLPADAPLPLPADRPRVGACRTQFQELFSMRTAPLQARLIDRALPLRRLAIDARASAVLAAEDALSAATKEHGLGRTDLAKVLACAKEHLKQRQAFIGSVCRYNHDIADYALAVVGPGTTGQGLVGVLIKPAPARVRPLVSGDDVGRPDEATEDSGAEPAGLNEPVPTPAKRPIVPVEREPAKPTPRTEEKPAAGNLQ